VVCLAPRAPGDSVRPRRLSGVAVRPLNFTVRAHLLTAFDKLWWVVFTVVSLVCMIAGACVPLIYLISPEELPALGHNYSLGQVTLCLGGMALGFTASLTVFGFVSRRFVSAPTHQRWAEYLDDATYAQRRYPGLFKLLRWVLLPGEHRTPPDEHAL
jgi:hypothetical protein